MEGALLRTGLMLMNGLLGEQAVLRTNRQPTANRVQTSAPSDIFATSDGHILTHIVGDGLFARWARMIGEEDQWVNDPRFRSDDSRGEHRDVLCNRMADWCATRTTDEAIALCEEFGVPAGPVLTPQQALDDPQVQAMGDMVPTTLPGVDTPVPVMGPPFRLTRTPGQIQRRPPLLGEHTDQIMKELGYSEAEMTGLRDKRVI